MDCKGDTATGFEDRRTYVDSIACCEAKQSNSNQSLASHPPVAVRRDSCSSNGSSSLSCTTPDYDSGNYSGTSELVFPPGVSCSSEEDAQHGLELRSMRSQLERLAKSERWYKNELKVQKRSKLDLLEKLYVNERKFMRENQKLQIDCKRLYALCTELERQKSEEKEELMKQLKSLQQLINGSKGNTLPKVPAVENIEFELQRYKSIVEDHEHLIKTLRSQKQNLLEEIRSLIQDRDAKLLDIERKTIALEFDNRTVTKRCLELVKNNAQLEEKVLLNHESDKEVTSLLQSSRKQHVEIEKLTTALAEQKRLADVEINHLKIQLENSNSKIKGYHQELSALNTTCVEKQLQNEHLEAEIEQYKKMRENYDKYVTLLQGNSAELDSKCMEIEHLQSVVEIQSTQISELNRTVHENKNYWKNVVKEIKAQLKVKDDELSGKQLHYCEQDRKRSSEIHKLRDRLGQLENLNEKLLSQLRNSSSEITKKSSEVEELKAMIRGLEELNVENSQLKKLLEIKDEELNQRKFHDIFVSELQIEIQKLKCDLRQEVIKSKKVDYLSIKNVELEQIIVNKEHDIDTLKQSLLDAENQHKSTVFHLQATVDEFKEKEASIQRANSKYLEKIELQAHSLHNLSIENENLKLELSKQNEIQAELDSYRSLINQYEGEKLRSIDTSQVEKNLPIEPETTANLQSPQIKDVHKIIQLLRETSQKVPETCDKSCQTITYNLDGMTRNSDPVEEKAEIRDLKLLQRVIENEHRKRIARYEVHTRTLLRILSRYRNRDAKEKSKEVIMYERKVETLQEQLRLASRRCSELDHYKRQNLQLTSNLRSLTDDYKKALLSISTSPKIPKLSYNECFKLIDKSNNIVPNFNQLIGSLDELKEDISQMKIIISPHSSTPKAFLHPVKRLSLMDELQIANENLEF